MASSVIRAPRSRGSGRGPPPHDRDRAYQGRDHRRGSILTGRAPSTTAAEPHTPRAGAIVTAALVPRRGPSALCRRDAEPRRVRRPEPAGRAGPGDRSGRLGRVLRLGPPGLPRPGAGGGGLVGRLGVLVLIMARPRPARLAREAAAIDLLSGGRLVFGAGLGSLAEEEFAAFGEDPDARGRAAKLDAGLEVVTGLGRGETVC